MNSDTPRTDVELSEICEGNSSFGYVRIDFARQLERELTAARAEIARLQAGGCARNQRLTQYCQEAVDAQARVKELKDSLSSASEYLRDLLAEWKWKQGAGERNDKQYCELSNFITAIDAARKTP